MGRAEFLLTTLGGTSLPCLLEVLLEAFDAQQVALPNERRHRAVAARGDLNEEVEFRGAQDL